MEYQWDNSRRTISIDDARLNRSFIRQGHRYATISEYAQASGIDTTDVVALLAELLDDGTLSLEVVDGEVFVNTAPFGRPAPAHVADVPPNLWERLRDLGDINQARGVWSLIRALERVGWNVTADRDRILGGRNTIMNAPYFGVEIGTGVVPVIHCPSPQALLGSSGLLSEYERANRPAVAVVCAEGALDEYATTGRRWMLSFAWPPQMSVVLLEAPRFGPVIISPEDGAVRPVNMTLGVDEELGR